MSYANPTLQGRFAQGATATNINLSIPSSFDWMWVYNETQLYAATPNTGAQFYFQRGMTNGQGVLYTKENTIGALVPSQIAANSGFIMLDTSSMINQLGASTAITNTTNATNPVLTTASTAGMSPGQIVRLYNMSTGHSVDGMDFVIDNIPSGTTFRLGGLFQAAPFTNGAATGNFRIVNYNSAAWSPWYPPFRYIIKILRPQDVGGVAGSTFIVLNAPSNYLVGQKVVFSVPNGFGATQLDGLTGTITAVTNGNASPSITVNIDSTSFGAFTFINSVNIKSRAIVAPVGEDTGYQLSLATPGNILNDAVYNNEIIGVTLVAGASSPAGQANDVIYWIAGSSASVTNN